MPTVADLRARRLELTRASLRERLVAADYDDVRVVVESLSDEFDPVDIAAAAVKMAHDALGGNEEREIPTFAPGATAGKPFAPWRFRLRGNRYGGQDGGQARKAVRAPAEKRSGWAAGRTPREAARSRFRETRSRFPEAGSRSGRDGDGERVRLFVGAGRDAGIRPGDLVGAITGEAGVPSRALGAIEIADKFSLVEVPDALADRIIAALKATKIRGNKVNVRREKTI